MRCPNNRCQADNAPHQTRCVACQTPLTGGPGTAHGLRGPRSPRSPEDHGRFHFLRDGRNAIGRDEECEVRVDDASVSKTHAFIYIDADGMRLVDNSQNGSVVDGRTIRGAQVSLTPGSKLDLGGARYVFVPIPPPFEK